MSKEIIKNKHALDLYLMILQKAAVRKDKTRIPLFVLSIDFPKIHYVDALNYLINFGFVKIKDAEAIICDHPKLYAFLDDLPAFTETIEQELWNHK